MSIILLSRHLSSLAVPPASVSRIPATCFAFASGLANIPTFTLYTKKSPSKAIFLAQSKIFHYLWAIFDKICNIFEHSLV